MDVVPMTRELCFFRFPAGHAYLWHDADGLTLIDSGVPGSAAAIAAGIGELGYQLADLRRVVLTHFHIDHAGSAAAIARWGNVEVIAHRDDAPFITGETPGPEPTLLDWERPLYEQFHIDGVAEPVKVDRLVDDGDVLGFGGGARVVAAPGHTPGSIAVHLPRLNALIAADAAARLPDGTVILGVFNWEPALAAESFRRLAALSPALVCFGHGEPLTENAAAVMVDAAGRMGV